LAGSDAVAFFLLIAVLFVRPSGLFGSYESRTSSDVDNLKTHFKKRVA